MKPFTIYLSFVALCVLLMSLAPVGALAQTSTPTPSATPSPTAVSEQPQAVTNTGSCSESDEYFIGFDSSNDLGDWNVSLGASWLASKTFGIWGGTSGYGVLVSSNIAEIYRDFYVTPGTYRIVYRAGVDWGFSSIPLTWRKQVNDWDLYQVYPANNHIDAFEEKSVVFEHNYTGLIQLSMLKTAEHYNRNFYIDYICLQNITGQVATPTPPVCSYCMPTATPFTQTPTPVQTQSTPIPTPEFECIDDEISPPVSPTPRPYTTTVTATPQPSGVTFGVLESFRNNLGNGFSVIGSGFNQNAVGFDGGGWGIPYKDNGGSPASFLDKAIVFQDVALEVSDFVYMDIWASADALPIGNSAYLHVWLLDADTSDWYEVKVDQVSARNWYVVQIRPGDLITVPSGGIGAIAITASRSDNPTSGFMHVDDWYIYNVPSLAPRCDGTYPISESDVRPGSILWPVGKPCPPPIQEARNFWGPLFTQFTKWMYELSRDSPIHPEGLLVEWGRESIIDPFFAVLLFVSVIFDFSYVFTFIGVALGISGLTIFILGWKGTKRTVNPIN